MWQYTTQIQSQLDIHIALLMQSLWKFIAQKNICIVICSICNTMSFIILESWQFGTNKTKEHYDRNPELYLHFSNENSHFCKSLFDMWRWLFPCHNLINKKMLHQSIHRHSQTGNEIHLLSIITLSNFFRHNTIYKNEHCSIKLTTHYSITADLQYSSATNVSKCMPIWTVLLC